MEIFQYDFLVRGLAAGIIIAVIAPVIGIFLVLKRYSLIADTLSHVSLAGVALGLFLDFNPFLTAIGVSVLASLGIEKLRLSKKVFGESSLAIFMSGSLAVALVLLSLARGFSSNLFSYLFGSIVTVSSADVWTILILAIFVLIFVGIFYKKFLYITFDEDAARVSGIPVAGMNVFLIMLVSLTVALAIPIVGALLISALIVIPAITALQLKLGFKWTIMWAEIFSLLTVISGFLVSYYFDISSGGAIVLIMLLVFVVVSLTKSKK